MYDLKHELISVQIKYENAEKALDKLKAENQELQMKIVQLETEMKNHHKKQTVLRQSIFDTGVFDEAAGGSPRICMPVWNKGVI